MPRLSAIAVTLLLTGSGFGEAQKIRVGSAPDCSRLVHYVRPVCPREAKRRHIGGTVKLRAVVGASGDIGKIEVLKGDPILVPAALQAVKMWRYSACLLNGDAVGWIAVIEVPFSLTQ